MNELDLLRDYDFGERVRFLRETCGLTQDAVANAMNIERSTLAYYESGTVFPSVNRLRRLAALFGVTSDTLLRPELQSNQLWDGGFQNLDEFLGIENAENDGSIFSEPELPKTLGSLTSEEQMLILYFRQLEDDVKSSLVEQVADVAEQTQFELYGYDGEDTIVADEI